MKSQILAAAPIIKKAIENAGNTIIAGNATLGYYGRIKSAKLITPQALTTLMGLTAGQAENLLTANWLKYSVKGKVLFVCDRVIRTRAKYSDFTRAGVITGRVVTILGKQYKVRSLLLGKSTSAADIAAAEWNKLMYPVCANSPAGSTPVWDNIPYTDLSGPPLAGFANNLETMSAETFNAGGNGNNYLMIGRGGVSIDSFTYLGVDDTYSYAQAGWRPVLEEV